jgi:hypothetical protein
VPFGKAAVLLSQLLPLSGGRHASRVRNRTRRVGEKVVSEQRLRGRSRPKTQRAGPVVIGLDGGHVRSCNRQKERHFEVIAGKVVGAAGSQHRLAFVRNRRSGGGVHVSPFDIAIQASVPPTITRCSQTPPDPPGFARSAPSRSHAPLQRCIHEFSSARNAIK